MEQQSTRNIVIGIIVLLLAGVVAWYYFGRTPDSPAYFEIPGEPQQVSNPPQRLEFTYYGGPDGYTLLESLEDTNFGDPNLVKAYTLVETDRYMETQSTEGIGDRIPAITMLVFEKPDTATTTSAATGTASTTEAVGPTLREWAEEHSGFTAYGLRTGEAEDTRLDNVSAIRFTAQGPFMSETYVVESRGKYYVLVGQDENEDSEIRRAFEKLLTPFYFL